MCVCVCVTVCARARGHVRVCCRELPVEGRIRLLDVGSCYNPFLQFDHFLPVGVDISPATPVWPKHRVSGGGGDGDVTIQVVVVTRFVLVVVVTGVTVQQRQCGHYTLCPAVVVT